MVGALLALAALLRFGFVANFISEPVLTGFKAGIGLVIVLDQAPRLLGLQISKTSFLEDLSSLWRHLPETSTTTLLLAVLTLLVLAAMEHWLPHSPAPLLAVGGGIAASWLLGLGARGVATVGAIPAGLPSLTLPDLTLLEQLLPGALGIALMSFTETIAAGRAFRAAAEPPILANRELVATGAANLAGGLLGAMPAGGGTTQTAVQRALGARSQLASLVVAATAGATLLFLAPLFAFLPQATLAAVVIVYSVGLIRPREFAAIRRVRHMEFRWAVVACLGVLLFGTLRGILVAIVVSLLALARMAANPEVHRLGRKPGTSFFRPVSPEHPQDETFPGLLMARPEGSIFFVNAQRIGEQLHRMIEAERPRVVTLDLRSVPDLEYTGLRTIMEAERRAREHGVELWLVALNPEVLEVVRRSGLADRLGPDAMFFSLETAVERFLARPRAAGPDR